VTSEEIHLKPDGLLTHALYSQPQFTLSHFESLRPVKYLHATVQRDLAGVQRKNGIENWIHTFYTAIFWFSESQALDLKRGPISKML
jgi:hypothetical protein